GSVVPCTRPFDRASATFGNIASADLRSILNGAKLAAFADSDRSSQSRSESCPWFALCHNGCPQHRVDEQGAASVGGASVYCECQSGKAAGNSAIWSHLAKRTAEIIAAASEA